jgi:hypothetical protein
MEDSDKIRPAILIPDNTIKMLTGVIILLACGFFATSGIALMSDRETRTLQRKYIADMKAMQSDADMWRNFAESNDHAAYNRCLELLRAPLNFRTALTYSTATCPQGSFHVDQGHATADVGACHIDFTNTCTR